MQPLDPEFRLTVEAAIKRARDTGRDLPEYLHTYGLLASPQWRQRVEALLIATVADEVRSLRLADLLGGYGAGHATAQDVLFAVSNRLADAARKVARGELTYGRVQAAATKTKGSEHDRRS